MEQSQEYLARKRSFERDPDYILHRLLYDIAETIYAAMEEQGLSQTDLAERVGAKRQFVNRFLNTPANTTVRTIVRLANAMDRDIAFNITPRSRSKEVESGSGNLEDGILPFPPQTVIAKSYRAWPQQQRRPWRFEDAAAGGEAKDELPELNAAV